VACDFDIAIADTASPTDRHELAELLNEFNMERTGYRDYRDLCCFLRDGDGQLVAGVDGFTWGGYAHVETVWVAEALRGRGLGRKLLEAAEAEAEARGCVTIVLSSHEFQAPDFYTRLGYELAGATEDTPVGYRQLTFQKQLGSRP